ncbi:MAG: hypothetical protein RI919_936 [Actinomycetota bacterium]
MATDYDAPRKSDDDAESLEAIKERIPEKIAASPDIDDSEHGEGILGHEVISEDLEVVQPARKKKEEPTRLHGVRLLDLLPFSQQTTNRVSGHWRR